MDNSYNSSGQYLELSDFVASVECSRSPAHVVTKSGESVSPGLATNWSEVYMAMLVKNTARYVAAFDASGKEDLRCIVVAGFVSSAKDWEGFHQAWRERLAVDGLCYFHMSEFAHSTGTFREGWKGNDDRRKKIFGDLVGIIKSHAYRSFACVMLPEVESTST